MIAASRLRHRIEVQRKSERKDDTGSLVPEFQTFIQRSAEVTGLSKDESVETGIHFNKRQIKVLMRYTALIELDMYVLYRNELFSIVDSDVNPDRTELTLKCEVLDV